jgi:hypothetical protein
MVGWPFLLASEQGGTFQIVSATGSFSSISGTNKIWFIREVCTQHDGAIAV